MLQKNHKKEYYRNLSEDERIKKKKKKKNRRKIITMKKLFNHLTSYIKELKKVCLNKFSDNLKA